MNLYRFSVQTQKTLSYIERRDLNEEMRPSLCIICETARWNSSACRRWSTTDRGSRTHTTRRLSTPTAGTLTRAWTRWVTAEIFKFDGQRLENKRPTNFRETVKNRYNESQARNQRTNVNLFHWGAMILNHWDNKSLCSTGASEDPREDPHFVWRIFTSSDR
jgi:hypothetical protein